MEQLLRDGGDLDSMDRSLLDYGANRNISVKPNQQPPQAVLSPTMANNLPPPPQSRGGVNSP